MSSSRQNTAILRHLAELDRENHKDTHIPIPTKQKGATAKGKIKFYLIFIASSAEARSAS